MEIRVRVFSESTTMYKFIERRKEKFSFRNIIDLREDFVEQFIIEN